MTKSKAIQLHCLTCSGESPKEVTLCVIPACTLWEFRFGYSMNDKRYAARIQRAARGWPKEYQETMNIVDDEGNDSISPSSPQINITLDDNDDKDEGL
jgi:hypothetical protein